MKFFLSLLIISVGMMAAVLFRKYDLFSHALFTSGFVLTLASLVGIHLELKMKALRKAKEKIENDKIS